MSFLQFAADRGLIIHNLEHGRWSRVPTVDHPHKRNGAYWYGGDFGHVQNWALMDSVESWQEKAERTPFEQQDFQKRMEESRKQYASERKTEQSKAAQKAQWILDQCKLDRHQYLEVKGFEDARGNVWSKEGQEPVLVIPMYYRNQLCGCQLIGTDGSKKFLTGQRTNNATFTLNAQGRVFLCEGYATGLSLKSALTALRMPYIIHVCFSAGNLVKVAHENHGAFVIADNDASKAGEKAAIESGCNWWMPETVGNDFNDLWQIEGTFKASQVLRKHLK